MSKPEPKPDAKTEVKPEPKAEPKPSPMRRWGGIEYPEPSFIRVTFLMDGSLNGQRFTKGKSGDVPKKVFEETLKPRKQAKLYEAPKPVMAAPRPAADKGQFRRHK